MKKFITILMITMITVACSSQPKETYTVEEAIEKGDVVIEVMKNKTKSTNLEEMVRFMKNTEEKKSDTVQVSVFQNDSSVKMKVEYEGNEYIITEERDNGEIVSTCKSVDDWSGQYIGNDCVQDGKKVAGAVRIFEASQYDHNKAKQKVRFESKKSE